MEDLKLGKYLHYKGTVVEVVGVARHSETMEELVVYRHGEEIKDLGPNTLWARPKQMFIENVIINGQTVPRFKYLDEKKV